LRRDVINVFLNVDEDFFVFGIFFEIIATVWERTYLFDNIFIPLQTHKN